MYLFHYTNAEGMKAIVNSGYIKASYMPGHAVFGEGVYLTAMDPRNESMKILLNNWDSSENRLKENLYAISKVQYCIAVPIASISQAKKLGAGERDVWLYPGNLYLQGKGVAVYER